MKLSIRVIACALAVFAAAAFNFPSRATTVSAAHQASVPGPVPYCNPYTENCKPIR